MGFGVQGEKQIKQIWLRRGGHRCTAFALLLLILLLAGRGINAADNNITPATPDEIKAEFNDVPCKNGKRQDAVKALFIKLGATDADIKVEKFSGVENVVVRMAGTSPETVIIGAHYDKVSAGCGAIDNWTGIVAMAHLYHSLRNVAVKKTLLFVAFGREEEGLIGSKAMVKAMSPEQVAQVCAMVNLDSFGMGAAQAAANMSSKKLMDLAGSVAKRLQMPYGDAEIKNASADSVSFLGRNIPAITLHGVTQDWPQVLHSDNDKPVKVDAFGVYLGYRLALALAVEVINKPCDAWR